ncbi:hypothetical protein RO575_11285 [Methylomonas sp. MO1]|uniref:hypothetical protein n=1 Tax=Methylomonas sp. MO1 TaxID=3073619 RepID=UPI0028A535CC|nr:hypothetical protein [Methylomonas sp. MO1]MDT4290142.1 hypothetical protein [Methylomonas sp. MO1]
MKLSSLKMCRNAGWISRLIILTIAVVTSGGVLSGCHPCSIPGACEAPSATEIVAFIGGDGAIYFDIPARKNYKRAELTDINILRVDVGEFAIPYWGMSKPDYTDQGKLATEELDLPWPLRYGHEGVLTDRQRPRSVENGNYRIDGEVRLYDEKGKEFFKLFGRFRYENGAVSDYSTE